MKKLLTLCLAMMLLILSGCGEKADNPKNKKSSPSTPQDSVSSDVTTEPDVFDSSFSENTNTSVNEDNFPAQPEKTDSKSKITEIIPTVKDAYLLNPQHSETDKQADELRNKILNSANNFKSSGRKFYIAPNGSVEEEDGTSPEKPWSLDALSLYKYMLEPGDTVLFERGSVYRLTSGLQLTSGVTYTAYGKGNKPALYGSEMNYAKDGLWFPSKKENIWRLDFPAGKAGSIVYNHGEAIGTSRNGLKELNRNGDFFCNATEGFLYLYCDKGYPQDVYKDIEIAAQIGVSGSGLNNVTVENLTFKYFGSHAINVTNSKNITVRNCEFGWIGGGTMSDENSGEVYYGNAVQFWENAENINVSRCWIYQVYDTGITFQGSADGTFKDIRFSENLIEYCHYSIEFFSYNGNDECVNAKMENISIDNNIIRFSGYGWGFNRDYVHGCAAIVGWHTLVPDTKNFKIINNIFDCSARSLICWYWAPENEQKGLIISGNSFYQKKYTLPLPDKYISGYDDFAAMTFGPTGNDFRIVYAKNQKELEDAVKLFDPSPKLVKWVG